ncbi:MAG: N-acetylglucosamine-6-phosphate deacetylase [Acidimicrobiales bacterium]|nr:N-acetylglucosamine-6-phosphate deacetylase [Acidimicrobiales bacterium]
MTSIRAARVVTPGGVLAPGEVVVDDGTIVAVGPTAGPVPDRTLAPGFVDLQVNGIDDVDVAHAAGTDWARLDELLARQGVTTWCPTLVTAPLDAFDAPLARIAGAATRPGPRPTIGGAHVEGPFLGGAPGAHPVELLRPPDRAWLASLPPVVRLVTLAPELPGAIGAVRDLTGRGVLTALGHSTATFEQARAAVDAGARLVTHCFNGMAPLHHRAPGLVGAALTDDRLAVSLIADLVHVHPAVLALAFRAKPAGRVVLVTDAVAWRAGQVGSIAVRLGDGVPRLPDGTLAGSTLTMDRAVANVVGRAGVTLAEAVRAASTTPAGLLGLHDRGEITPGKRADLVALDGELRAETTWVAGEAIHGPHR